MPKAEVPGDIEDAETNQNFHFCLKNMSMADDGNLQTNEDFKKCPKCELTADISKVVEKGEDSVSNVSMFKNASFESSKHASPQSSNFCSSSSSSQSSFIILKSESSVEKFNCDKLKKIGNESLNEWDLIDNKITVQDSVGEKQSTAARKHFEDNGVLRKRNKNLVAKQDESLSLSAGENEIKEVRETLEKCLLHLKKINNGILKQGKLNPKKDNLFPASDRTASKCKCSEKDEKIIRTGCTSSALSTFNGFKNNRIIDGKTRTLPEACMTCVQSSRCICNCCNESCLNSNPTTIEWGLDTYEVKGNRNRSRQVSNVAKHHPSISRAALSGKSNMVKKKKEYFSKRNEMADSVMTHQTDKIENPGICCTESEEECSCKRNKKSMSRNIFKTNAFQLLDIRHFRKSGQEHNRKRNKRSNQKKTHKIDEFHEKYSFKRNKKPKLRKAYKTGKIENLGITHLQTFNAKKVDETIETVVVGLIVCLTIFIIYMCFF